MTYAISVDHDALEFSFMPVQICLNQLCSVIDYLVRGCVLHVHALNGVLEVFEQF